MTEFKSSQQPKCGIVPPDPRDGATRAQNDKHLVMTNALKSSSKSSSCLLSVSVLELNDLINLPAERREKSKRECVKTKKIQKFSK